MKVLVCGGRDYDDAEKMAQVLGEYEITLLAHGAYRGADTLAEQWAEENQVISIGYPAAWRQEGRKAGPRRNRRMLADFEPDLVIAFPGRDGTADMVGIARRAGVEVREIL